MYFTGHFIGQSNNSVTFNCYENAVYIKNNLKDI